MSVDNQAPRRIHLGGPLTEVNDLHADGAITPGHLITRSAGKYKKHATAGGACRTVALQQSKMNKGIDDAYADGDLVEAGVGVPGSTFYMIIPSGENIADGGLLKSNGDGTLVAYDTGVVIAQALEAVNNAAGPSTARIKVEFV